MMLIYTIYVTTTTTTTMIFDDICNCGDGGDDSADPFPLLGGAIGGPKSEAPTLGRAGGGCRRRPSYFRWCSAVGYQISYMFMSVPLASVFRQLLRIRLASCNGSKWRRWVDMMGG